ncbi:soma ferritin-like, partial [Aphidius gifuensis]
KTENKTETNCDGKIKKWPSDNKTQYNFHPEIEAALNQQINMEFKAFYNYLSMASYFGRVDVALPGCESFFLQMHHEEHEHALILKNYIKIRGGTVNLCTINPPNDQDWKCPLNAFKIALDLEMSVADELVAAEVIAQKHKDQITSDFIIDMLLKDQMKSINEMAKFVNVLSGIGDQSLTRFIFDKDLLKNYVSQKFNVI